MPNTQPHIATSTNSLNKLRASVLGANDGIVSTAGLVLGVTGAAASKETILLAGFAGLVAGAISMAAGEFVSVSSQRDSEKAFLNRIKSHIKKDHTSELYELVEIYKEKGISTKTATQAAKELATNGTLMIELEKELGIDPDDLTNPWSAAIACPGRVTSTRSTGRGDPCRPGRLPCTGSRGTRTWTDRLASGWRSHGQWAPPSCGTG